ncbi:MAG: hypothetical protein JJV99_13260 [Colwellia sp.]|uniref:hypothetical protein n=1 Tax=Pseudoalteromonas sp. GutCa3 TaxID=888433 RepID=UPI000C3429A8|nr:hypothetical protein [Pseudoalteromonas sp. GutCa3]MBL0711960.1 hypothetical protein [Colwellia sp.]PKG68670.1 hypothetical protein CXF64_20325 [Pseudoalteromonas sp. GutCa3]|tara:strand:+ start:871 stop:1065 length:195 start_codon:yes stop_codon:yes gene_type:complete
MSEIQLKLEEKYAILNGVRLPRPVFNLLMKNERLLAINKYRLMTSVSLSEAVETITPLYESITE